METRKARVGAFVLGLLLASLVVGPAFGITRGGFEPRRVVSYCIAEHPAEISLANARNRLNDALEAWESAGGIDGSPTLDLSQDIPCNAGTDVRVVAGNLTGGTYAVTQAGGDEIEFDNDNVISQQLYGWWDGIGTRGAGEPSYEGVLVHEIGHTFSGGHAGTADWSGDNHYPSMAQTASFAQTPGWESIEMNEWALAVNISAHATSKPTYITPNPGFEEGFDHFGHGSAASVGSAYANTGDLGARLLSGSGSYIWTTAIFDPWNLNNGNQTEAGHMNVDTVLHTIRSDYRHTAGSTTGAIEFRRNTRNFRYDPANTKTAAAANPRFTAWTGQIDVGSECPDQGTSWNGCSRSFNDVYDTTNDASWTNVLVRSTSSATVYIDRFGMTGGTHD